MFTICVPKLIDFYESIDENPHLFCFLIKIFNEILMRLKGFAAIL